MKLTLSDGLPAYASTFYIYLTGDSLAFDPKTVYPVRRSGQIIVCQVTKQKLILNRDKYKTGAIVIAYLDAEFTETATSSTNQTKTSKYYLKGFIRTQLNE